MQMENIRKDIKDHELINLLQQKKLNAYEFLYDRYAPMLYGVICKLVSDDVMAQKVLKKSFIQIWSQLATMQPGKSNLFIWMHNITRNIALKEISGEICIDPVMLEKNLYQPATVAGFGAIMLS
jgi:DNA-directed RNA polymerase specialized sigma24 family protein